MKYADKKKEENTYVIAPVYKEKFRPAAVVAILKEVLNEKLEGAAYHVDGSNLMTKSVADEIRERLKEEPGICQRYKFMVQVVIAEER